MNKHISPTNGSVVKTINLIAMKNVVISPDELKKVDAKLTEEIPPNCDVLIRPLESLSKTNLIMGERLYTNSYVTFVNLAHGDYWDGFYGELDGHIYDIDGGKVPKGFFKAGELYAIDYVINKGDVVAVAEVRERV